MEKTRWGCIAGRGTVGLQLFLLLAGAASAQAVKPETNRAGGLPVCEDQLATCQSGVTQCETELLACEATPKVVFPGDGEEGTSLDFGLDHGPALSYTDHGDGTFTDDNTHLMWEEKTTTGCAIPDVHCVDNSYTWTDGSDGNFTNPDGTLFTVFLATLNTPPCFAGHCDWRLPTVKELESIVDHSQPSLATSVPGATVASFYWSSTSLAGVPEGPDFAWGILFFRGSGGNINKSGNINARAVRGSQ